MISLLVISLRGACVDVTTDVDVTVSFTVGFTADASVGVGVTVGVAADVPDGVGVTVEVAVIAVVDATVGVDVIDGVTVDGTVDATAGDAFSGLVIQKRNTKYRETTFTKANNKRTSTLDSFATVAATTARHRSKNGRKGSYIGIPFFFWCGKLPMGLLFMLLSRQ